MGAGRTGLRKCGSAGIAEVSASGIGLSARGAVHVRSYRLGRCLELINNPVEMFTNRATGGAWNRICLPDATGGRAFFPFQVNDVANAFAEIQDELRSQYALSYKPADFRPDGRYRSIEILAQNKNLRVRSRKGYFAPK